MWELSKNEETKRTYRSSLTGTEITTSIIYTDATGRNWWAFDDLLEIPHIRKMAANNVSQLYGMGFSTKDLLDFAERVKTLLKSSDTEKYEKTYSEILTLEGIVNSNLDPVKQELGLCAIYILADDERIDTFSSYVTLEKMEVWALDLDAQAFFLNWLSDGINDFTKHYNSIIQTASMLQGKLPLSGSLPK